MSVFTVKLIVILPFANNILKITSRVKAELNITLLGVFYCIWLLNKDTFR